MIFVAHHVGARFGNTPLQIPDPLKNDFHFVLFDADEDCIEGLAANSASLEVVQACLSDGTGTAAFNITINPSASSLLAPSEAARGFVQPLQGIDWDVADCARVVERRSVATTTLDALLSERPSLPRPDFLSLDTQGSELAIISGARETISQSVIGMIVEVEFVELYQQVPRVGRIFDTLEEAGFHFCGFADMINANASRQPIGLSTDGFPVAADALFLRRIDAVEPENIEMLSKLAIASLLTGFLDHAVAALTRAGPSTNGNESGPLANFLRDLRDATERQPQVYLPRFPDILPKDQVRRFSTEPDPGQWRACRKVSRLTVF